MINIQKVKAALKEICVTLGMMERQATLENEPQKAPPVQKRWWHSMIGLFKTKPTAQLPVSLFKERGAVNKKVILRSFFLGLGFIAVGSAAEVIRQHVESSYAFYVLNVVSESMAFGIGGGMMVFLGGLKLINHFCGIYANTKEAIKEFNTTLERLIVHVERYVAAQNNTAALHHVAENLEPIDQRALLFVNESGLVPELSEIERDIRELLAIWPRVLRKLSPSAPISAPELQPFAKLMTDLRNALSAPALAQMATSSAQSEEIADASYYGNVFSGPGSPLPHQRRTGVTLSSDDEALEIDVEALIEEEAQMALQH